MNARALLIVLCFLPIFLGCKKGVTGETFTIKFEVVSTAPLILPATINTKVGLSNVVTNTDFTSGSTWSKTTTIETAYRPIELIMNAQNLFISMAGSATSNIYVNGTLKASTVANSFVVDNKNQITTKPVLFTIQ